MRLLFLLPLVSLLGCASVQKKWADTDRQWEVAYNTDNKGAFMGVTLTSAATPGKGKASVKIGVTGQVWGMNGLPNLAALSNSKISPVFKEK